MVSETEKKFNNRGFTLMELMVAMTASFLIIAAAFVLWNSFSEYMIRQRKNFTALEASYGAGKYIYSKLKRCEKITSLSPGCVEYVTRGRSDTVKLTVDSTAVMINSEKGFNLLGSCVIRDCFFEILNRDEKKEYMLMAVDYKTEYSRDNTKRFRFLISTAYGFDGSGKWNLSREFENFSDF